MWHEQDDLTSEADEVIDRARAAEKAIQQLCHATIGRPSMTPAEIDASLAHLASAAAALPQAARQLGRILERAKYDYTLEMDTLTETAEPDLAVDTACLHLEAVREPALSLYRLLDAAHNETAHIRATDHLDDYTDWHATSSASFARRPEDREPPSMGTDGTGPSLPR